MKKLVMFILGVGSLISVPLLSSSDDLKGSIAVFTGSFDPIHCGHIEIIEYILAKDLAKHVFLQPDTKVNRFKPARVPIEDRLQMLKLLFQDNDHITVTLDATSAIERARVAKNRVLGVLGSDNYIRLQMEGKKPQLRPDLWLIITRDDDKDNEILREAKSLGDVPVLLAPVEELSRQGCSSTQIRKAILQGQITDAFLDQKLRKYIDETNLYK